MHTPQLLGARNTICSHAFLWRVNACGELIRAGELLGQRALTGGHRPEGEAGLCPVEKIVEGGFQAGYEEGVRAREG
jgi:hypothetical protein